MFERLDNFRDFGGYPAEGGRAVAGRLFRSAHHAELSDADLTALEGLGLKLVVDLRQPSERQRHPSRRPPEFAGAMVQTDFESTAGDPWINFLRQAPRLSARDFEDYIRAFYRGAAFEPGHIDVFSRYFRALSEVNGPVLIHCMAGKDRTGILVALTHRLLGVSDEHVYADYLLSNDPTALPARIRSLTAFIAAHAGRTVAEECARAALLAHEDYLRLAFETIDREHGSIDGYFENVLGIDSRRREVIRGRLVIAD